MANDIFNKANQAFELGATNEEVFAASRGQAGLSPEEMAAEYIPEDKATGMVDQYFEGAGTVRPSDYRPSEETAAEVAGMASMLAPFAGLDPIESFQRIKTELTESGNSSLLRELESLAIADRNEATRELFTNVLVEAGRAEAVDPTELQDIVTAYKLATEANSGPAASYEAMYEMVAANLRAAPIDSFDEDEQRVQLSSVDIGARLNSQELLQQTIDETIASVVGADASTLEGVYELGESLIPFKEQLTYADIRRGMVDRGWLEPLSEVAKPFKNLMSGELFVDVREKADQLRREDPERAIQFWKDLGEVIQEQGLVDSNGMMGMFYLLSVADGEPTSTFDTPGSLSFGARLMGNTALAQALDGFDWDRWLSDMASVADLVGAGFVLREVRAAKQAATGLGDVPPMLLADTFITHRPTEAAPILAQLIKDRSTAVAHGTTPEDVADHIRPKHAGVRPRSGPTNVWSYLEDTILAESGRKGFIYTDEEKANGLDRIRTLLSNSSRYSFMPEKSYLGIAEDGQSIEIDAVIGATDNVGFPSYERAKEAAEELTDQEVEFFKTGHDGFLVNSAGEDTESHGEWFFRVKMNKPFVPEDALMFGEGANFTSDGFVGLALRKGLSPTAKFSRPIVMAGHRAHDMGAKLQTLLLSVVKKPWESLSKESKLRVQEIIERGDREKINFTDEQLVERYPTITKAEMDAYFAQRKFWDVTWTAQNRDIYNRLDGRGVKHILNEKAGFETAGSRVSVDSMMNEVGANAVEVFDADTGRFVMMRRESANAAQGAGIEFFRVEERIRSNGHMTDFVMVSHRDAKVRALPRQVMRYEPGYYPRIYENKFFVREVTGDNVINGKRGQQDSRAIVTASSAEEARRLAAKLSSKNTDPKISYVPVAARELTEGDVVRGDIEALNVSGRLFYSRRGEHLPDATGAESMVVDPVETIQRLHHALARHLSSDEWLDTMRARFFKTYRKLIDLTDEEIKNATDTEIFNAIKAPANLTEKGVQPAKAMWNYIRVMSGIPPQDGQLMRKMMVGLADVISTMSPELTKPLTKAMIENRNFSPLSAARSAAFQMYIALNPFRQVFLQAQQQLYLFGAEPAYFSTGLAIRQQASAIAAYSEALAGETLSKVKGGDIFKHIPSSRMKMYAKVAGMDTKEFEEAIRRFRNSGLVDAIDEHMFIAGGSLSPKLRSAKAGVASKLKDVTGVPIRGSRKIGFDSGEFVNMMASYFTAIHRFKTKNPELSKQWYTDKYIDQIYGDARDLGLAMTKSGSYEWQHGAFANLLQFFSIQQKAVEGFLANKAFTPKERLGLVAGQLALFGASGIGVAAPVWYIWDTVQAELYPDEEPVTIPDGVEEFVNGGLADLLINKALEGVSGEDQDLRVATNIAAGSGWLSTTEEKAVALVMSSRDTVAENLLKFFAGPSGTAGEQLVDIGGRASQAARIAWQFRNHPEIRNENAARALYTMAEVASGYNNYIKGRMWMNMQKNNVLMEYFPKDITEQEAFVRQWFGFPIGDEQDYWDTIKSLESGFVSSSRDENIQAADEIYSRWKDTFLKYGLEGEGKNVNPIVASEIATLNSWVMMAFEDDPIAKTVVMDRITSNMLNDLSKDRTSLATLISNSINQGAITTDELADWKQRTWNNNAFSDREKRIVVEMLDRLMTSKVFKENTDGAE